MEFKVVITDHAQQRIRERGADPAEVKAAVRRAAPLAPVAKATAIHAVLPVIPIAKFFRTRAVVTTVLAPDSCINRNTEVVYA